MVDWRKHIDRIQERETKEKTEQDSKINDAINRIFDEHREDLFNSGYSYRTMEVSEKDWYRNLAERIFNDAYVLAEYIRSK